MADGHSNYLPLDPNTLPILVNHVSLLFFAITSRNFSSLSLFLPAKILSSDHCSRHLVLFSLMT